MSLSHSPRIVTNGLVGYWDAGNAKSYPGSGTSWFDLSNTGNTGTLVNSPTFNSTNGGYFSFNGTNQYVSAVASSSFAYGTGDFTISYWAYINAFSGTGTPIFVDNRTTTAGAGFSDYILTSKYNLYWNNANRYTSTLSISTGYWYHVAVSRISSIVYVYFNGVLDGTVVDSTNLTQNAFLLARNLNPTGTSYLNGNMSAVMVYKNKGLSASEVQQNFNALRGRFGL